MINSTMINRCTKSNFYPYLGLLMLLVSTSVSAIPIEKMDGLFINEEFISEELNLSQSFYEKPTDTALQAAYTQLRQNKLGEAIGALKAYIIQHPESASGRELLGVAFALNKQLDQGINALKQSLEINPRQHSAITKLGDIYFSQGRIEEAEKMFIKATQIAPKERKNHQRLGIIQERDGKYLDAIASYEKGIKGTAENYVGVKANLGRLYNYLGRFQKTIELLEPALKTTDDHKGYIVLGTSYLQSKRIDDAISHFKKAEKLKPNDPAAYLSLGIAYRAKGENQSSLAALQKLLALKPRWPTTYYQLAETQLALEAYDEAEKGYLQAIEYSSEPKSIKRKLMTVYIAKGHYDQSIATGEALLKSGDTSADLWRSLGLAWQLKGDQRAAINKAASLNQQYAKDLGSYHFYGNLLAYYGQYEKAVKAFNRGLKIDTKNYPLLKSKSVAQLRGGSRNKAIETAKQLAETYQNSIEANFYYASLLNTEDETKIAENIYRRIIANNAEHVPSLNNLAMLLANKSQYEEATRLASKAYQLQQPESADITDTLAWVLHLSGKHSEANKYIQAALKKQPNNPEMLYHLAAIQYALGNKESARNSVNLALDSNRKFQNIDEAKQLQSLLN